MKTIVRIAISALLASAAACSVMAKSCQDFICARAAIEANDVDTVLQFSAHGEDLPYDAHGNTILHIAAELARPNVLAALLDAGYDVDVPSEKGTTPLMMAAYHADPETAGFLLKNGADIDAANRDGGTALIFAAIKNSPEMVTLLLDSGADPLAVTTGKGTRDDVRGFRALDQARKYNPALLKTDAGRRLQRLTYEGTGCEGAIVLASDKKLTIFADRILGYPTKWKEIAELNGLGPDKSYRAGDCLKLPQ